MLNWLNPFKAIREHKEAKRRAEDSIATAKALEQHERAARVLAASIERSRKPTLRAVAPLSARQAVIDEQAARVQWQAEQDRKALERMREDEDREDRRRRNASSDAEGSYTATSDFLATLLATRREEARTEKSFAGDGGTFGGGGASGDWESTPSTSSSDSGTCSASSSDSGSSSSDSSSSSCGSDSGSSASGD